MRCRFLACILVVSLALNLVLCWGVCQLLWKDNSGFFTPDAVITPDSGPAASPETPAPTTMIPADGNDTPYPFHASPPGPSARKAVLEGPAVVTSVDSIRRGPFVYQQINQTGTMLSVSVEVVPGEGRILVQTKPLMGVVFQDAANTAVAVAANRTGVNLSGSDIIFSIQSDGVVPSVEGPSAGALMALLVESALEGKALNPTVTITGTIAPDGKIGAIGGVMEKATAARNAGKTLFLLPGENSRITGLTERSRTIGDVHFVETIPTYLDAKEFIEKSVGIRVEYVGSLQDAERFIFQ